MSNKQSLGLRKSSSMEPKVTKVPHDTKKSTKENAPKETSKRQSSKLPVGKNNVFSEKNILQTELIEDKTLVRNIELKGINNVKATSERQEKLLDLLKKMSEQEFTEYKASLYNISTSK